MRSFIFTTIFFLVIEYYTFIALRTSVRHLTQGLQFILYGGYALLTLGIFVSLFSFFYWRTGSWPSDFVKLAVNFFIGFFLAKVLVTTVMFAGDLFLGLKWMVDYVLSLGGRGQDGTSGLPVISRSRFISHTALFLGGMLASGLAYGVTNRYRYKVRREQLNFRNLPRAFRGLKIAQISDIHSGSFDNREAVLDGVEAIMAEKPDLILFSGDLVNNLATEIEPYMEIFSRLKAPLGVYSVLGNHDYGDYVQWPTSEAKRNNLELLKQHHAGMGWKLLLNEHVILDRNGDRIALAGVENWGARGFTKYGNLEKALSGLESGLFKILMSHDPSHWDAEVRPCHPDVALTLSGHTHGMQFGIEVPGLRWSPVQYMYKQWAGVYKQGEQYLYVNRGYGFIGYQGRLGILPEIAILELV